MKINNHDAYCVEWYRRLIADGTAEDGQRIAVDMHDQLRELEQQIESEKHERENPEPLTLEQLREMEGEPLKHWVWIEVLDPCEFHYDAISGYYRTSIDFTKGEAFCCGWPGLICAYDYCDYGKTWVAYAHKPGGEV